jgi:hypothetical protein
MLAAESGGQVPERKTLDRVRNDLRQGKAPTTQAGEFVREEIDRIKEGKHGDRSAKRAIAIGLSKAPARRSKVAGLQRRATVRRKRGPNRHATMPRGKTLPDGRLRRNGRGRSGRRSSARAVKPRLTWRFSRQAHSSAAVAAPTAEAAQPRKLSARKVPAGFEAQRETPLGRSQLAEDKAPHACSKQVLNNGSPSIP